MITSQTLVIDSFNLANSEYVTIHTGMSIPPPPPPPPPLHPPPAPQPQPGYIRPVFKYYIHFH